MADIPNDYYPEVVDRAIREYDDIEQPFGTAQLRSAWQDLQAELRNEKMKAETNQMIDHLRTMADCKHEYEFAAATADDPAMIAGYYVCLHCQRTKPVWRRKQDLPKAAIAR